MRPIIPPPAPTGTASIEALERILADLKSQAVAVDHYREESLYQVGRRQLHETAIRSTVFDPRGHLFGDPAWAIMLGMFVALNEHQILTVSDAASLSCAPPTTGLRYLTALINAGYLARKLHMHDRRKHLVELTERGESLMQEYLAKIAML